MSSVLFIIFMDRIFRFFFLNLCWLLRARTSSISWGGLQPSMKRPWFSTGKRWFAPSGLGGELLPQVEEFKYLGILFTSEERMERETDRRIGAADAVMRPLYQSVVVKRELS